MLYQANEYTNHGANERRGANEGTAEQQTKKQQKKPWMKEQTNNKQMKIYVGNGRLKLSGDASILFA